MEPPRRTTMSPRKLSGSTEPPGGSAPASAPEVSELLGRARRGDRAATDELMTLVYDDLRRLADRYLSREPPGRTLQPTALVHEAYLRLASSNQEWQDRAHFFGAASRAIRRILLDRARARRRERHGGTRDKVPFEEAEKVALCGPEIDVLVLDEALERLSQLDPAKAHVVELRFFGGLGIAETAEVLGVSPSTVARDWRFARVWLHRELENGNGP
jgi:RNA polymerase sigma factor (TIGR02999 family)